MNFTSVEEGRNSEVEALRATYMALRLKTCWWTFGRSVAGFLISIVSLAVALLFGDFPHRLRGRDRPKGLVFSYAVSVASATTEPSSFVIFNVSSFLVAVPWMRVANFGCGAPPTSWATGWPSFFGIHR
jgi:hypothetical protein